MNSLRHLIAILVALALSAAFASAPAHALQPVEIGSDTERIELTPLGQPYEARGDALQIETARAADGTTGRMAIRATTPGTTPHWFVFALTNTTDKPIERWLVAERYAHAGSGIVWPDLDARRLENVTPSLGFIPERLPFDNADAFRLTLEPGQTVTYAVELSTDRTPRMQLWRSLDYEKRSRNRQLFHGILLGITGLLAIFLTVVFAANHKAIFPAAALFTWAVLAYLCVDFGFWHKLFNVRPEENATYRAAGEALMALSLLVFAHVFLRLGRWHGFVRMLLGLAMLSLAALFALAFLDPRLATTFARLALAAVLALAVVVTLYLAALKQDRALAIIPTWILFSVWLFGAALVHTGRLSSDIVVNGLTAGLVLLVVLIGFTVTQFAFRAVEPLFGGSPSDQQLRALAMDGTGSAVFDWNARRDEIRLGPQIDAALGLEASERQEPTAKFLTRMHPADRDRFQHAIGTLRERRMGSLAIAIRLRHMDGSYRWFDIEASALPATERGSVRVLGLVRETTDQRHAQERLLHDAVHDTLTGLANRTLLLDRLDTALIRARSEPLVRPLVIYIDLDRFSAVNAAVGLTVGDSLLMAVARRLQRLVPPGDTLARVGGDQFALMFVQARDERELRLLGDDVRAAIKGPIAINGQEIVLTGSIGITEHDGVRPASAADLLSRAEAAMLHARRSGPDRVERYIPQHDALLDQRAADAADLRSALERRQIKVVFRPIVFLHTEGLAGFEALARWEHPRLGTIDPQTLDLPDTATDVRNRLGAHVLQLAAAEAVRWKREYDRPEQPLFVSVNISRSHLLGPELHQEVRHLIARSGLPKGALRLEIPETAVMDNPEQASEIILALTQAGARVALDDFGAGYSSLAFVGSFPIDTIKIDAGLVAAAGRAAGGTAIVRSVVALAHELGKIVVADGVDSEDVVGLLRTIGCELAQGEYYGQLSTPKEALQLVKQDRRNERRAKSGLFRYRQNRSEPEPVAAEPAARPVAAAPKPTGTNGRRLIRGLVGRRAVAADAPRNGAQPSPQRTPRPANPAPTANGAGPPPPEPAPTGPPPLPKTAPTQPLPTTPPPMPRRPMSSPADVRAAASVTVAEADRALARLRTELARPTMPPATGQQPSVLSTPDPLPLQPSSPAAPPPQRPQAVDLSGLPPAIAQRLVKLAGRTGEPPKDPA